MHIIVTGSRSVKNEHAVVEQLEKGLGRIESLTHGDCPTGADRIARDWAGSYLDVPVYPWPAQWAKYGRAAGPRRNTDMVNATIDAYGTNRIIVLAFTDKPLEASRGTAHCVSVARKAGLTVHHFVV